MSAAALLPYAPALLEILRALPPAQYGPKPAEALEAREHRYARIAIGMDRACSRAVSQKLWPGTHEQCAGILLTLGYWESRFAHHVHAGNCRPKLGECDPYRRADGTLVPLATSPWQVQKNGIIKPAEWKTLAGTDLRATYRAAWAATRVISHSRRRCKGKGKVWVSRSIAAYATGKSCSWRGAPRRAHWYERHWVKRKIIVSAKTRALLKTEFVREKKNGPS